MQEVADDDVRGRLPEEMRTRSIWRTRTISQRQNFMILAGAGCMGLVALAAFLAVTNRLSSPNYLIGFALVAATVYLPLAVFYRTELKYPAASPTAAEKTSLAKHDYFKRLVASNADRIARYVDQTQSQANRSFYLSLAALTAGFLTILYGVEQSYQSHSAAGAMATAAGVVAEVVGAGFFALYNRTIQQMSYYYRTMLMTQNVVIATTISEMLPAKDRVTAQKKIITSLIKDLNAHLAIGPVDSKIDQAEAEAAQARLADRRATGPRAKKPPVPEASGPKLTITGNK